MFIPLRAPIPSVAVLAEHGLAAELERQSTTPLIRMPASGSPITVDSADHHVWGAGCDGWHLVRSPGLSVIQERMPPGAAEVRHRHRDARQFFFVLAGELRVEVDGAVHVLGPRAGLEVAPGLAHEVRNAGPAVAEFLVVSQPPSHGDRTPAPPPG